MQVGRCGAPSASVLHRVRSVGVSSRRTLALEAGLFFLLGFVLALPSAGLGLWSDDVGQGKFLLEVLGGEQRGPRAWWDLYTLVLGDPRQRFSGIIPWWSSPELRVAFFRPLSAVTHLVDYWLWPDSPWAMHLHSGAWFGACVSATRVLFEPMAERRVSRVATVLFAVSFVHASPMGWIAQRNALVGATFALVAVSVGRSFLRDGSWGRLGACLLALFAALLGSEGAVVGAACVVLAAALSGNRRRALSLSLSTGVVVVVWRVAYAHLGYGVAGSGTYVDPINSPLSFLQLLPGRTATLALTLFFPQRDDLFGGGATLWSLVLGVVALGATLLGAFRLRGEPLVRFSAIAVVTGLLAACTAEPHPRLLVLPSVFVSLLVGMVGARHGRAGWAALAVLGSMWLAAQQWSLRHHEMRGGASPAETANLRLPDSLRGRVFVIVDPPRYVDVYRLQRYVAANAAEQPQWWLALSTGDSAPRREGCCTIVLPATPMTDSGARFFSPDPSEVSDFEGLWFDARRDAERVSFEFKANLDAPQFVILTWRDGGWAPWTER